MVVNPLAQAVHGKTAILNFANPVYTQSSITDGGVRDPEHAYWSAAARPLSTTTHPLYSILSGGEVTGQRGSESDVYANLAQHHRDSDASVYSSLNGGAQHGGHGGSDVPEYATLDRGSQRTGPEAEYGHLNRGPQLSVSEYGHLNLGPQLSVSEYGHLNRGPQLSVSEYGHLNRGPQHTEAQAEYARLDRSHGTTDPRGDVAGNSRARPVEYDQAVDRRRDTAY